MIPSQEELQTLSDKAAVDRPGRRMVFLTTMALFVVLATAQAFAQNMWELVLIRFLLGVPPGSDIASGYTYKNRRSLP